MTFDKDAFHETLLNARMSLLDARQPGGHWHGKLSSSALATATAVCALAVSDEKKHQKLIHNGLEWLAQNRNSDGGWGDTAVSISNISATVLGWAAFGIVGQVGKNYGTVVADAQRWLEHQAGGLDGQRLAKALGSRYGKDHTFAAPIMSMCAISGRLGLAEEAWQWVEPLPFELAMFPSRCYKWLCLQVVSYALPALIAIGQARHCNCPSRNPVIKLIRRLALRRTRSILKKIQPESGGFLEAITLTSFVVMNMVAGGAKDHAVVKKGIDFIVAGVRDDGSWPIDTDLATWVSTLSVNALSVGNLPALMDQQERDRIGRWLLGQQFRRIHLYTHARPGGWGWTDCCGAVPDADDTAGALLAIRNLGLKDKQTLEAARAGVSWLLHLQNSNGGMPTFCKGWKDMPFDRSGADLTAHAIMALITWRSELGGHLREQIDASINKAITYLAQSQRKEGSWSPLWFGNQFATGEENLIYGTVRVLTALNYLPTVKHTSIDVIAMLKKGTEWLVSSQNPDGGWGGTAQTQMPSSIEETALAVAALAGMLAGENTHEQEKTAMSSAVNKGLTWLIEHTERGSTFKPAPIGFYFAKLWYFEELYPVIFTVAALEQVKKNWQWIVDNE